MAGKRVADVMTKNPRAVEPGTPVTEAARLLRDEDVGSLPVITEGRVVGVITDRDITVRVVAEPRELGSTTVGDVYSRDPVTVQPAEDLDEALRLMARHQVRRLPVVEEDDRLVGILAQADVAIEAGDERAGEAVEEISRPTPQARR